MQCQEVRVLKLSATKQLCDLGPLVVLGLFPYEDIKNELYGCFTHDCQEVGM